MTDENVFDQREQNDLVDEFLAESEALDGARRPNRRDKKLSDDGSDFARRRRLATTAIAGLGVLAAACAVFAFARERWAEFNASERATIVFGSLAALYACAGIARRFGEISLSDVVFLGGAIFFGAGIVLLREKSGDAEARLFEFWALGVFALAATLPTRLLHYLAAFALSFWFFGTDSTRLPAAFALCAIGEYWAWRRKSSSVAAIYFLLALVAAATRADRGAWEYAPVVAAASGLFCSWFGATFRSAVARGVGLVVGTAGLAVGSFSEYWTAFRVDAQDAAVSPRLMAAVCAVVFVAVACRQLVEGARRSAARFFFAVSAFLIWLVWQAASASRSFGATGTAVALAFVAFGIFGGLFLERRCRLRREAHAGENGEKATENVGKRVETPTTDAIAADAEFDDFFDAEARAAANAPRLLAISAAFDESIERLENWARVPAVWAAIGVQFAILFGVFWSRG